MVKGASRRGLAMVAAGLCMVILAVMLLMLSVVGQQRVLADWEQEHPTGWEHDYGPCGFSGDYNTPSCNSYRLYQSLWWIGWILLFVAIAVGMIGGALGRTKESLNRTPQNQNPPPPHY